MPVVWLRKFGIKCLYQPNYCQQLGLFAGAAPVAATYRNFLNIAASLFPYIHINLNPDAIVVAADFRLQKKKNLLLPFGNSYAAIQKKYSENHQRNISKAIKAQLAFAEHGDLKSFQKFYLQNINRAKENFKPQHEKIFKKLTQVLISNGRGTIYTAQDKSGNLQAAVLLVTHKTRLTGIINTSSAEGKKQGASHFVFDQIIQKFSGSGLVLDFEGSSIPGIARFYEGFGATEETFYSWKHTLLKNISQRFA